VIKKTEPGPANPCRASSTSPYMDIMRAST
jgi:hypothetical protein